MNSTLAPIEPGVCYPLPIFMSMVGQGRNALAQARRDGLTLGPAGTARILTTQHTRLPQLSRC